MPEMLAGDIMMEIQYAHKYENDYGERVPCYEDQTVTRKEFLKEITDIHSTRFYFASSLVRSGNWFRWPHHVLLLDCDSTGSMLAACNTLAEYQIGYALIQSSPSHYWLVVDKVGKYDDLTDFAKRIPGVDDKYLKFANNHNKFYLRISPYLGKIALFQGSDGLKNKKAIAWYNEFEELWNSEEVRQRARAERLVAQIKDGTIFDVAADPEFKL